MTLLIMSVPCIFTPFIRRGGEAAGRGKEDERRSDGEKQR